MEFIMASMQLIMNMIDEFIGQHGFHHDTFIMNSIRGLSWTVIGIKLIMNGIMMDFRIHHEVPSPLKSIMDSIIHHGSYSKSWWIKKSIMKSIMKPIKSWETIVNYLPSESAGSGRQHRGMPPPPLGPVAGRFWVRRDANHYYFRLRWHSNTKE